MVVDPVTDGVVSSAERPGNITGVTTFDPQQPTKRLRLLMETIPGLARVAILGDQGVSDAQMKASEAQARALGLQPQVVRLSGPNPDIEGAFAAMGQMKADAVLVLDEPLMLVHRKTIAEVAIKHRIGIMGSPSFAEVGGLINYGTSNAAGLRQMWTIVDKVIKGAKAGDLPVRTVVRYDLIVNVKTASALGVTIPPAILQRADRVIQ